MLAERCFGQDHQLWNQTYAQRNAQAEGAACHVLLCAWDYLKPTTSSPNLRHLSNWSGVTCFLTGRCNGVGCKYCPNVKISTPCMWKQSSDIWRFKVNHNCALCYGHRTIYMHNTEQGLDLLTELKGLLLSRHVKLRFKHAPLSRHNCLADASRHWQPASASSYMDIQGTKDC